MLLKQQTSHTVRCVGVPLMVLCTVVLALATPWVASAATQACQGATVAEVKGMSCPFCAYGLRKHLLAIPGVKSVQVDLNKSQATIDPKDGSHVSDAQIQQAIKNAGFSPGHIQCEGKPKAAQVPAYFKNAEFTVEGMRCKHCAANITATLERERGVQSAVVSLAAKRATVEYDTRQTNPAALIDAIDHAGRFHAAPVNATSSD